MRTDASVPLSTYAERKMYNPTYQAFQFLHWAFVIAPILAGADKFFHYLANWNQYLAPQVTQYIDGTLFMKGVGVVEVIAGLLVAFKPRIGGYVVMVWLWGIIANLLMVGGYLDIAARDLGLSLGAYALANLARHEELKNRP